MDFRIIFEFNTMKEGKKYKEIIFMVFLKQILFWAN